MHRIHIIHALIMGSRFSNRMNLYNSEEEVCFSRVEYLRFCQFGRHFNTQACPEASDYYLASFGILIVYQVDADYNFKLQCVVVGYLNPN